MADVLRVTDETTRDELVEALGNMNRSAKRTMAVVGTDLVPTPWDRFHARINALLDDLERAPA